MSLATQIVRTRPAGCVGQVASGWFPALCPEAMTPEFVATLQRALAARGLYQGGITGQLDPRTHAAIGAWQGARGLPNETLSVRGAQQLGLIPWLD